MNGLRQVLFDYVLSAQKRHILAWALFVLWLLITALGAVALIGGVKP